MTERKPGLDGRVGVTELGGGSGPAIPRLQADRSIAVSMGWLTDEEAHNQRRERLIQALRRFGVSGRQIDHIIRHYHLDRIEAQVNWLPLRRPTKPAALIVAAIRHNYEPPADVIEDSDGNSSEAAANDSSLSLPPEQKPNQ